MESIPKWLGGFIAGKLQLYETAAPRVRGPVHLAMLRAKSHLHGTRSHVSRSWKHALRRAFPYIPVGSAPAGPAACNRASVQTTHLPADITNPKPSLPLLRDAALAQNDTLSLANSVSGLDKSDLHQRRWESDPCMNATRTSIIAGVQAQVPLLVLLFWSGCK